MSDLYIELEYLAGLGIDLTDTAQVRETADKHGLVVLPREVVNGVIGWGKPSIMV